MNNDPESNFIALKKGTDQNLTCNRLSEFVPFQWLKVNEFLILCSINIKIFNC